MEKGPYLLFGGEPIPVRCFIWPSYTEEGAVKYTSINNIDRIPLLNPRYDQGMSAAQRLKIFGPYGCINTALANQMYTVRWGTGSMLWGVMPDRFWYWPTKICQWVFLPPLIWVSKHVVIPLPIMYTLRHSAYGLALCCSFMEFLSVLNDLLRKMLPLFQTDELSQARTIKEFEAAYAKKKHGLFMNYENFDPKYRFLYFLYCPLK